MKIKITTLLNNFPNYSALNYSALRTNLKKCRMLFGFFVLIFEVDFVSYVVISVQLVSISG